jgi:hypothetical protein
MLKQFKIELTPEAKQTVANFEAAPARLLPAIAKAMNVENANTVDHIRHKYLSFARGGPSMQIGLRYQSGRYNQSLNFSPASVQGDAIVSSIGTNVVSKDGVSYPAVHEFGATIPAQTVYPKNKRALSFFINGQRVTVKSVKIGERHIPARAPIQHGVEDRKADYIKSFSNAVINTLKNG